MGFNCWATKGNSYLANIIEEYNTTNDHCVDGDITIWTTRPASPPVHDLLASKNVSAMWEETSNLSSPKVGTLPIAEAEILDHLYANAPSLTWFNNASEGWASAVGNEGKTDTSCVLVGN